MQIPLQDMPEQEPEARVNNFAEVPLGFEEAVALAESMRCLDNCKAPCIKGCPVGIDIPAFIKKIEERDFIGAARTLKKYNLLPAICGRVCPQQEQCELVCVIGKKGPSVGIGRLERFAADYERMSGLVEVPEVAPSTGRRVAVVGSGPAGLTGASELARLGHKVTIFETLHRPGGVLVSGIPGENMCGVYSANEFLTRVPLMRADLVADGVSRVFCGQSIAVIGAGDTAM